MSDTATIIDNYLAARDELLSVLDEKYVPAIEDRRGRRWGIVRVKRSEREELCIEIVGLPGFFLTRFGRYGHAPIPEDIGEGITIVRENYPQENTVFLLTTAMRDDEAASQKAAP